MSEKPLGLRERNRIRTRESILNTMAILLGERSFENITLDDVSRHAGVSRGTIYGYFPDGREQLLRDAYVRAAETMAAEGLARRSEQAGFSDRIVAIASAFASMVATDEGRFYGLIGPTILGPLSGVTGTASGVFATLLTEDLEAARNAGLLKVEVPVEDLVVLLSGTLREIGVATAKSPDRAVALLTALRVMCESLVSAK